MDHEEAIVSGLDEVYSSVRGTCALPDPTVARFP